LFPSALFGEISWNVFIKKRNFFSTEEMGVNKLSAKVLLKVN